MSVARGSGFPDRLLDASEAAELLGVELCTIRQWTYQRRIPVVHPAGGRAARYRLSVLLQLMAQWEQPALQPLAERRPERGALTARRGSEKRSETPS